MSGVGGADPGLKRHRRRGLRGRGGGGLGRWGGWRREAWQLLVVAIQASKMKAPGAAGVAGVSMWVGEWADRRAGAAGGVARKSSPLQMLPILQSVGAPDFQDRCA